MYQVFINDVFRGMFRSESEAHATARKLVEGFSTYKYRIVDPYGNTIAEGKWRH